MAEPLPRPSPIINASSSQYSPAESGRAEGFSSEEEDDDHNSIESEMERKHRVNTFMSRLKASPVVSSKVAAGGRNRATIVRKIHRDLAHGTVSIHDDDNIIQGKTDKQMKEEDNMNAKPKVFIPFATKRMGSVDEDEESDEDTESAAAAETAPGTAGTIATNSGISPSRPIISKSSAAATSGPFRSPGRKLSIPTRPVSAPVGRRDSELKASNRSGAANSKATPQDNIHYANETFNGKPPSEDAFESQKAVDDSLKELAELAKSQRRASTTGRRTSVYAPAGNSSAPRTGM